MNSVTHVLKRVVCCVRGHRPFPKHDVPETPPEPKEYTIGHITGGTGIYLNNAGNWSGLTGTSTGDQTVSFIAGPVTATARVCARCHGVYWNSTIKGSFFMSTKALPELDGYMKWQDRQNWEAKQRGKNELAKKLYDQYQVALKLVHVRGDDDAAT